MQSYERIQESIMDARAATEVQTRRRRSTFKNSSLYHKNKTIA